MHAYAARIIRNTVDKDEFLWRRRAETWSGMAATVASYQKRVDIINHRKWSVWTSGYQVPNVPEEKRGKRFNLLILPKLKRDKHAEITKLPRHKARLVMDGAQIGINVFDTYAPVIDYSTVSLSISLAFGKCFIRKCFIGIFLWRSQMQKQKKKHMLDFLINFQKTYFLI